MASFFDEPMNVNHHEQYFYFLDTMERMIDFAFTHGTSQDALEIRKLVFLEEQGFKTDWEAIDETAWCLVLYWNQKPIATASFFPEDPETFHLRRVAVLQAFRHQKVGSYLLRFAETKIKDLGGRKVTCFAQLDKVGFYEKNGYQATRDGEVTYEENVPHLRMEKIIVKSRHSEPAKNR